MKQIIRAFAAWLVLICMLVPLLAGCDFEMHIPFLGDNGTDSDSSEATNALTSDTDVSATSPSSSEIEDTVTSPSSSEVKDTATLPSDSGAESTTNTPTDTTPKPDNAYPSTALKANAYLYGETVGDALSYEVGESIRFRIRLTDSANTSLTYPCSRFVWNAEADDGQTWSGSRPGDDGELKLSFKMNEPGAIRLTVKVVDHKGKELTNVKPFVGGAFCGFDQITTGVACPDDFDAFWQSQLEVLDRYQPEAIEMTDVGGNVSFYTYSVKIRTHQEDAPVTGYITIPKNATAKSLKLKLFFYGYNASMNKPTPQYNSGYITFAVNAHSMENRKDASYYSNLKELLGDFGFSAADYADPSTSYFRNMILRNVQALRFAKKLPQWNGRDIELTGGSMGGFQATSVAALEPGVTKLSVHIVWMCDVGGRSVGRLEGWLPEYSANLNYFDSVNFAVRVTCPTYISRAGLIDYTTTPIGVAAYYNALQGKKTITFVQSGDHLNNPRLAAGSYTKQG